MAGTGGQTTVIESSDAAVGQ